MKKLLILFSWILFTELSMPFDDYFNQRYLVIFENDKVILRGNLNAQFIDMDAKFSTKSKETTFRLNNYDTSKITYNFDTLAYYRFINLYQYKIPQEWN